MQNIFGGECMATSTKPVIRFSHNWNNKLSQKYFTTIRKYTESKYDYYFSHLREVFDVLIEGKKICEAELIDIDVMDFNKIPEALLIVDTGSENYEKIFWDFGIWGKCEVMILTFKRVI